MLSTRRSYLVVLAAFLGGATATFAQLGVLTGMRCIRNMTCAFASQGCTWSGSCYYCNGVDEGDFCTAEGPGCTPKGTQVCGTRLDGWCNAVYCVGSAGTGTPCAVSKCKPTTLPNEVGG